MNKDQLIDEIMCAQSQKARLVAIEALWALAQPKLNFITLEGVVQTAPIITQHPHRAVFVLACSLVYKEGKNIVLETIHYPVPIPLWTIQGNFSMFWQMAIQHPPTAITPSGTHPKDL